MLTFNTTQMLAFLIVFGSAFSTPEFVVAQEPIQSATLGATKNVHQCGNLFFAGQFNEDDIVTIKDNKVTRVITLRTEGEIDWDEEEKLKAAGLGLIKIPFRKPETLTDEVFDQVRALLRDRTQTTLFHCGSANRVGGVWLPYRVLDEGVDLETALREAKEIGLRTAFIEQKAIDYIKRKQDPPVMNGETSVKPGINKSFIDPNLDVDDYVSRFEIESREIFVARERILSALRIKPGQTVADVGAGTGLFTRLFSVAAGGDGWVYAVDISPRFIDHIREASTKLEPNNISCVLCSENSVCLPPNSVDLVFVCDTYHHFEYPKSTMASIHRALKKDGNLIVIDFNKIPGQSREWIMGHVRAGREVFQAEIEAAGFVKTESVQIAGFTENYFLRFKKK